MALPRIDHAVFKTTVPSTGKEIRYRGYTVKEEKLLLMAKESKNATFVVDTFIQVLQNCVVDGTNVSDLASFDIEHMLIRLREISVGETMNMQVKIECDDPKCDNIGHASIKLKNIKLSGSPPPKPKLKLSDQLMVTFKYPSMITIKQIAEFDTVSDRAIAMVASCVDQIVQGEEVYNSKDYSQKELMQWVEGFDSEQFNVISEFMNNLPTLKHSAEFQCNKCKKKEKVDIEGFDHFFF